MLSDGEHAAVKPTVTVTVTTDDDLVEGGAQAPVTLATEEPVRDAVQLTAEVFGCTGLSCWLWHDGGWLPSKGRLSETRVREGANLELRRRTDICHTASAPGDGW